jgi:hypothetical protein
VSARFEELDWSETRMGVISLRRRIEPSLNVDVYEVKLGDEFLMSSLFTVAEIALARLGLAQAVDADLDVVVGGLGLGYTAQTALNDPRIHSLVVVEALAEVIGWHQHALLPDTAELVSDPRVRLQRGDFFAMADSNVGFDPEAPGRRFHAVLLDIDHTPRHLLHPSHCVLHACGTAPAWFDPHAPRRLHDRVPGRLEVSFLSLQPGVPEGLDGLAGVGAVDVLTPQLRYLDGVGELLGVTLALEPALVRLPVVRGAVSNPVAHALLGLVSVHHSHAHTGTASRCYPESFARSAGFHPTIGF